MKGEIFIPTSNRVDSLTQCLNSLRNQTLKTFSVFLVGLRADKEVERLIATYMDLNINYFIQEKPGIIGAANEAIARMDGDIFIRIDDDVVLDPEWFENLMETFSSEMKIGGVTGPTVMSEEGINSRDLTNYLNRINESRGLTAKFIKFLFYNVLYENKILEVSRLLKSGVFTLGSNYKSCLKISGLLEVDHLEACNWSCRRDLLVRIGGFDEGFTKGLGDYHESDAAIKIRKLGYKLIFNPIVRLKHNVEVGKVESSRPASYYRIQNFIVFYCRHFKITSVEQLLKFAMNVAIQNCYYLFKFFTTGKMSQLGGIAGTFIGLMRVSLGTANHTKVK